MASSWSFVSAAELEAAVRDLGARLDYPPSEQLAFVVRQRLEREEAPRRGWLPRIRLADRLRPALAPAWQRAAVALVVIVALLSGILVFSPSTRKAVAGWLGLRGVKIEVVPTLPPVPTPLGRNLVLGRAVSLAEAQAAVPFRILLPSVPELGQPDEIDLTETFGTGRVSLLYRARPGFPRASATGVGLLVTEFEAKPEKEFIEKKVVAGGASLEAVRVNGEPAFWIEGAPHELYYVDANGSPIRDTIRLAGNVLLWQHGSVTLRLEADVPMARALAIAESVD
jgi:hypothetical protein